MQYLNININIIIVIIIIVITALVNMKLVILDENI